jgi:hypothetical protein
MQPHRGHGYLSLVNAVCCHVEVFATGPSLVLRSDTECDVSECDREGGVRGRYDPNTGPSATGKKLKLTVSYITLTLFLLEASKAIFFFTATL